MSKVVEVTQDSTRYRLLFFLKMTGGTQASICDNTGIRRDTLNRFVKGKRNLSLENLLVLNQYLAERKY